MNKEKVRELAVKLSREESYNVKIITEWLEQNQPEPIVVGLSDGQINDYANKYCMYSKETVSSIKEWLKTQTFAQPVEFSNAEMADSYQALYEDFEKVSKEAESLRKDVRALKDLCNAYIKRNKELTDERVYSFDWSTIPDWAGWAAQDLNGGWFLFENKPVRGVAQWGRPDKKDGVALNTVAPAWTKSLLERPKPAPQIEVGQVWRCVSNRQYYSIAGIITLEGELKVNDSAWERNVQLIAYRPIKVCESKTYHRTMPDFLAKFERAQS